MRVPLARDPGAGRQVISGTKSSWFEDVVGLRMRPLPSEEGSRTRSRSSDLLPAHPRIER